MTRSQQKRFVDAFFRKAGAAARTLAAMFDNSNDVCFYIKDLKGRIIAINRRNCEISNLKDCWEAIGKTSDELFSPVKAQSYRELDYEVLKTGKSVVARVTSYPADDSRRFMISDVHPLYAANGRMIGTTRVFRLSEMSGSNTDHLGPLRKVIDRLHAHYAESILRSDLATLAGMSESAFRRSFLIVFGTSPAKYLTTIRLNAVRHLLETTNDGLAIIARKTGFYDESHLTRVFRSERNMTPGEYRRRHHERRNRV